MDYLHYEMQLDADDVVEVKLEKQQANVRLLDDTNFARYKQGEKHTYYGGLAERSLVHLRPPHAGHWHVVIDLGGYQGRIRASVRAMKEHHV